MLHARFRSAERSGSDELGAYRNLAASILAKASDDLRDPDPAVVVSAATFLWDVEESLWSDWLPVSRRITRPVVLQAVAQILRGADRGGNTRRYGRKLAPHHRATLAALVRRHQPVK
jgi:hypothetical protein